MEHGDSEIHPGCLYKMAALLAGRGQGLRRPRRDRFDTLCVKLLALIGEHKLAKNGLSRAHHLFQRGLSLVIELIPVPQGWVQVRRGLAAQKGR